MTRNKKVKQKLRGDGQQIADLERAVHKSHQHAAERKRQTHRKPAIKKVTNLLGSREIQETGWIGAVLDCERHAARMPITMVTGAVPVDLYRATANTSGVTNASDSAFVVTNPDDWFADSLGGVRLAAQLKPNGSNSYAGCATNASYVGVNFPTDATNFNPPSTGISPLPVPDISADFTSDANTGTEYIMVGNKTSISMVSPPAGADRFVGMVWAIMTLDPERNAISGLAPSVIETESFKQGSQYRIAKYRITGSGLFVPVELAVRGEEAAFADDHGVGELSMASIPLNRGAYEWQRIDGNYQGQVGHPNLGFFIDAPSGTTFSVRHTMLWQTERYSSALVRRSIPSVGVQSLVSTLNSLAQNAAQMATPGHVGGLHTAVAATLAHAGNQPGFLNQLAENLGGLGNLVQQGSNFLGALNGAVKGGQGLMESIQSLGAARPSSGLPAGWTIGRPPSSLPGSVSIIDEAASGGSGVLQTLEYGAEEAAEFAPELLSILA